MPVGKLNDYFVVNTRSSEGMSIVCEMLLVTKELKKVPKQNKPEESKIVGKMEEKIGGKEEEKKAGKEEEKKAGKEEEKKAHVQTYDIEKREFKRYQFGYSVISLD